MKYITFKIAVIVLAGINAYNVRSDESRNIIQINSDITVSCFFTVNQLQNNENYVYRIVSSSPRDCGAVDEKTGRLLETKLNLLCPSGYGSVGVPRGGPIGSHGVEIYYQAQGVCRAIYYLPLNFVQHEVVMP